MGCSQILLDFCESWGTLGFLFDSFLCRHLERRTERQKVPGPGWDLLRAPQRA